MSAREQLSCRAKARRREAIRDILLDQDIYPVARGRDRLDFHDVGVEQLRDMLEAAYLKGAES
jgi:hypothetical protein